MGAAQGDTLDQEVLFILHGAPNQQKMSKERSFRKKYITFCLLTGNVPFLPTKPSAFFRYALWLTKNGIGSSWDGAQKYIGAVVKWNREFGYPDFRDSYSNRYYWDQFRASFKRLIPAQHKAMKLPIAPAHLEAMAAEADLTNSIDLRDLAAYYALFFSGVRIGHVATSAGGPSHGMRFEDLHWEPSIYAPQVVYICFRSTKTRARAADTPYWSAIARQEQLHWCPLLLLAQHVLTAYRGRPDDLIFRSARDAPLARSTFVTDLRRRLGQAAHRLAQPVDLSQFAGVSFRKGFLSTLGPLVPSHRLADAADHSSVESSRIYTVDTLSMRAANSTLVASAFVARM